MLIKKTKPEKIHFFESDLEYRKGCYFLGHYMHYCVDNFSLCCIATSYNLVKTTAPISDRVASWYQTTTKVIDDIKNNRQNDCLKCNKLQYGFYPKTVKLDYLCFATNHPGDVCNLKCSYCFVQDRFKNLKKKKGEATTYETLKQLSQIPEYNSSEITVELSNGEICANKDCDKIFDIFLNNNWKARIVSNMTIYNEKFAELLKTGRVVNVLTSLDSGTPETFLKIKQADLFNKVVENIKKYPLKDVDFQLKYIFLEGINDNETDVNGFYDIVKSAGCKKIMISSDLYKPFTEKMRGLVKNLVQKAKADNIIVYKSSYLNDKDVAFIDEIYNTTNTSETKNKEINIKIGALPQNNSVKILQNGESYIVDNPKDLSIYINGNNNNVSIILPSNSTVVQDK